MLALLVDDADAVGVAVVGDAHVGLLPRTAALQVLEVLQHRGVGVVVGEAAVHVAEEAGHLEAQALRTSGTATVPADAVAGVDRPASAGACRASCSGAT